MDYDALLTVPAGSMRYGMYTGSSDKDIVLLTGEGTERAIHDEENNTTYFVLPVPLVFGRWGDPLFLGDLTGEGEGHPQLCEFLREHKQEIAYASPQNSAIFGLEAIAQAEWYGFLPPIKAGLRTAMILAHMAQQREDPFLLSEEEKATLMRVKTGQLGERERVEIYRDTISPENIGKLMRMRDHPTIKKELFQLIEEVRTC